MFAFDKSEKLFLRAKKQSSENLSEPEITSLPMGWIKQSCLQFLVNSGDFPRNYKCTIQQKCLKTIQYICLEIFGVKSFSEPLSEPLST